MWSSSTSSVFKITSISLLVEPSSSVRSDTNVTLRCRAQVSSSIQAPIVREYTIYKDSSTIYTKTSTSSEDLVYLLPHVRFSSTGRYRCALKVVDNLKSSEAQKLRVTGEVV